jgi:hypothetical protein
VTINDVEGDKEILNGDQGMKIRIEQIQLFGPLISVSTSPYLLNVL